MKKQIILIVITMCSIILIGSGLWLYFSREKSTTLYQAQSSFLLSEDTTELKSKLQTSEDLYQPINPTDSRISNLLVVLDKLNLFEEDLTSQTILNNTKSSKINKINKQYTKLKSERKELIKYCDTYIISMRGNTAVDGPYIQELYNNIFNKTTAYVYNYCVTIGSSADYIFTKINTSSNLKYQTLRIYIEAVKDCIENIKNNSFSDTFTLDNLNNLIVLVNGNIQLKSTVIGGEYSNQALKFVDNISKCDIKAFIDNFKVNYNSIINDSKDTPAEKLAMLYLKQTLGV